MAERAYQKIAKIRAWSGSPKDILDLAEAIDLALKGYRADYIASLQSRLDKERPLFIRLPWLGRRARRRRDELIAQATKAQSVTIQCRDGDGGSVEDMYNELTPDNQVFSTVEQVTIAAGVEGNSCGVILSRGGALRSTLVVSGDPPWARDTHAVLYRDLKENRPFWWFSRDPRFYIPVIVVISGSLLGLAFKQSGTLLFFVYFGGAYVVPLFYWLLIRGIFPPFELERPHHPNIRKKWARTFGVIGGVLVFLATIAGVVVPALKK